MAELNITSTAVEKGLDLVKGFVEKLVGGAVEEAGLLYGDKVRLRRLKNQIKILQRAQKIANDANIDIKQINLKVLVPLLEYTSLEEEETLQEMWAKLISNYADSTKTYNSTIYPFIMHQISIDDVNYLIAISGFIKRKYSRVEASGITIANLVRLGLIERHSTAGYTYEQGERPVYYGITELGKEFLKVCKE